MNIFVSVAMILFMLTFILIAQSLRVSARKAMVQQKIVFDVHGEHWTVLIKMSRLIFILRVRIEIIASDQATFYPRIVYFAEGLKAQNKQPRLHVKVELRDAEMACEFCKSLALMGYAYNEFEVMGSTVKFIAHNRN